MWIFLDASYAESETPDKFLPAIYRTVNQFIQDKVSHIFSSPECIIILEVCHSEQVVKFLGIASAYWHHLQHKTAQLDVESDQILTLALPILEPVTGYHYQVWRKFLSLLTIG